MIIDISRKVLNWEGNEATELWQDGEEVRRRSMPLKGLLAAQVANMKVEPGEATKAIGIAIKIEKSNGEVELSADEVSMVMQAISASELATWVKASVGYLLDPASVKDQEYMKLLDDLYGEENA